MNAASAAGVTLSRILGSLLTLKESRDYTRQGTHSQFADTAAFRHVSVAQAILPVWVSAAFKSGPHQLCLHFKSEISNLKLVQLVLKFLDSPAHVSSVSSGFSPRSLC
jgi:hypothetical protein